MSINELENRIAKMQEWESLAAEAQAEAEAIRDSIKAEMLERNTEELTAGRFIIRWTSVVSNRFDSSAFKKVHSRNTDRLPKIPAALRKVRLRSVCICIEAVLASLL